MKKTMKRGQLNKFANGSENRKDPPDTVRFAALIRPAR